MAKKPLHPNSLAAAKRNKAPTWQKGQSGNPKGNHKGTKHRATELKELLALIVRDPKGKGVPNPLNPAEKSVTFEKMINVALIKKALTGNVEAIKEIQDTVYGRMTDKRELTGADGNPLSVMIVDDIK